MIGAQENGWDAFKNYYVNHRHGKKNSNPVRDILIAQSVMEGASALELSQRFGVGVQSIKTTHRQMINLFNIWGVVNENNC